MKQHIWATDFLRNILPQFDFRPMQSRGHDKYFALPSIPNVTEFGPNLSGTADAKSWVIIAVGDMQYRTKADKQGNWQILNPIQDGGTATIFAMNNHGIRSDSIQIAQIPKLPNIPSTPEVIERGEYLVGKADAGNTVIVTKDGQEYITVADENGDWSMLNPLLSTGLIKIVAIDATGQHSEETGLAQINLPRWPTVLETGEILVGIADPNVVIIINANGVEYRTIADASGNWSIDNPIANGGTLSLIAQDEFGQQSIETALALPYAPVMPEFPKYAIDKPIVLVNADTLEGHSLSNLKILVTVNGQEYTTKADATGHWQMENPIKNGGSAIIVAEDHYGVRSEEISIAKLVLPFEQEGDLSALLVTHIEDQVVDQPSESDVVINVNALLIDNVIDDSQLISFDDGNAFDVKTAVQQQETPHLMMNLELSQLQVEQISTYWVA